VREGGGFPVDLMGPRGEMRELEAPAWAPTRDARISIVKMHAACNWAQVLEGSIDSAHSSSLHSTNMPPAEVDSAKATDSAWLRPSVDKAPRLQFEPTSYGFRYCRDPQAAAQSRNRPVHPHHAVHRAFHRADSAERPL